MKRSINDHLYVSGQGSQTKGMGIELFSYFPEQIKQADEILGYSVKELCLDDPKQQLNNTEYTQPALYIVEALSFWLVFLKNHYQII